MAISWWIIFASWLWFTRYVDSVSDEYLFNCFAHFIAFSASVGHIIIIIIIKLQQSLYQAQIRTQSTYYLSRNALLQSLHFDSTMSLPTMKYF
jgi:hypothetical protein